MFMHFACYRVFGNSYYPVEKVVGIGCADACFNGVLFVNIILAVGYGLDEYLSHFYRDFLVPEDVENQSVVF